MVVTLNQVSLDDLRHEHASLKKRDFPTRATRRFVKLALDYVLSKPEDFERHKVLEGIFQTEAEDRSLEIPPNAYVGISPYVYAHGGELLIQFKGETHSLDDLGEQPIDDWDAHLFGDQRPSAAWVDTGDEILGHVSRFLQHVQYLVVPNFSVKWDQARYAHDVFFGSGREGHAYFGGVNYGTKHFIECEHTRGRVMRFMDNLSEQGRFYGRDIDILTYPMSSIGSGFNHLVRRGVGALHNFSVSLKDTGAYALGSPARGGDLFVSGKVHGYHLFNNSAASDGQVRIFAPESNFHVWHPRNLIAVVDILHGEFGCKRPGQLLELYANNFFRREIRVGHWGIEAEGPDDAYLKPAYEYREDEVIRRPHTTVIPRDSYEMKDAFFQTDKELLQKTLQNPELDTFKKIRGYLREHAKGLDGKLKSWQ